MESAFKSNLYLLLETSKISLLRTNLPPFIWNWVVKNLCNRYKTCKIIYTDKSNLFLEVFVCLKIFALRPWVKKGSLWVGQETVKKKSDLSGMSKKRAQRNKSDQECWTLVIAVTSVKSRLTGINTPSCPLTSLSSNHWSTDWSSCHVLHFQLHLAANCEHSISWLAWIHFNWGTFLMYCDTFYETVDSGHP